VIVPNDHSPRASLTVWAGHNISLNRTALPARQRLTQAEKLQKV
jgi:hypothetical protein